MVRKNFFRTTGAVQTPKCRQNVGKNLGNPVVRETIAIFRGKNIGKSRFLDFLFFDQTTFFWTCRRVNNRIRQKSAKNWPSAGFSQRLLAGATCMLPYRAPPHRTGYMGGRFYVGGTVG